MAAAMAVWTSTAAPSMSRLRSNWRVMEVLPWELDDVMLSMPAMVVNWRSRGVATAEAMVAGSAPGSPAETVMVGDVPTDVTSAAKVGVGTTVAVKSGGIKEEVLREAKPDFDRWTRKNCCGSSRAGGS